ncbi:hypothetical protein EL26_03000, partial [Tumebacillus flagellatus]
QGVDKQAVIDLLVKQENARLDQAVTDGKMTSDQATQMKANVTQHVTDQVDGKGFGGGKGGFDGQRGGHGKGRGGHQNGQANGQQGQATQGQSQSTQTQP